MWPLQTCWNLFTWGPLLSPHGDPPSPSSSPPQTCSSLFSWMPPPQLTWGPLGPVQTYSQCSPWIFFYWQADGWPSTENFPVFIIILQQNGFSWRVHAKYSSLSIWISSKMSSSTLIIFQQDTFKHYTWAFIALTWYLAKN